MALSKKVKYWTIGITGCFVFGIGLIGYNASEQKKQKDLAIERAEADAKRLGFSSRYEMEQLKELGFNTKADFSAYAETHPLSADGEEAVSCSALIRFTSENTSLFNINGDREMLKRISGEMYRITSDFSTDTMNTYLIGEREKFHERKISNLVREGKKDDLIPVFNSCWSKFEPVILAEMRQEEIKKEKDRIAEQQNSSGKGNMSSQEDNNEDDGDVVVMHGKTKDEWRGICLRMADRKRECAVADDVDKCVKIKAGSEYDISQGNCMGDVPLFPK